MAVSAATNVLEAAAPPNNIQAEQALLGAILLNPGVLGTVIGVIKTAEQFYRRRHVLIFDSMLRLDADGLEIDVVTLEEDLKKHETFEEAGGSEYLIELAEASPSSEGARQYAEIVRDKDILRSIATTATSVREKAFTPSAQAVDLIEEFEREVFRLGAQRFHQDTKSVLDILKEFRDQVAYFKRLRSENNSVPGLPSGYKDLDVVTTGFKKGELIIMAARPGHGKTSLALNIATNVALTAQRRRDDGKGGVAFYSLEMRAVELISRVVCSEAKVNLKDVRSGTISPSQERSLDETQQELAQTPFFVDDTFDLSMPEIRAKSRRLKERYDIELVVVDYLQLLQADSRLDRHEQIGVISRGMKGLARELEIPVIALAQLNRSIESRRGAAQRPMLSDLRESGSIEQDADIVAFIQRDQMLSPEARVRAEEDLRAERVHMSEDEFEAHKDIEPATLIIAKNRSGPISDVQLMFRKSCTSFEPAEERYRRTFGSD